MQLSGANPVGAASVMRPAGATDLRVAQMNMWNLFDTVNDPKTGDDDTTPTPEQYQIKLQKLANAIVELGLPDLISANEIENETVMADLAARPELAAAGYKFLVQAQNNDERGIRVGVFYKGDRFEVAGVEAPNPKFSFPDGGRGQIDRSLLYARPPLVVDFKLRGAAQASEGAGLITIAVNHFKSKLGGEAPEARRQMQGQYLGEWLDARRATRPGNAVVVLGDLNANHGEGAYEKLAKRADGSMRLYDAPLKLPKADRYTYNYRGQLDLLDHVMVEAERADAIKAVKILHVNTTKDAKKSQWDPAVLPGYSDHDSIIVDLDVAKLLAPSTSKPAQG
jgi:predicted extracellular nuclease